MLRKVLDRLLPEPDPDAASFEAVVEQIWATPQFAPLRLFWDSLQAMRPWWPVLLPLLAWVGWRTYWRERERYRG